MLGERRPLHTPHPAVTTHTRTSTQKHVRTQEHSRVRPAGLRRGARRRQAQEGEAEEVRVADDQGHPVLQLPLVRPPRLLGPRPPRLRQHHGAEHRLLHPRHGVPVHRHHVGVRQARGDRSGDRPRPRAHVCARQGLLQEDGVVLHVQQAEQGAVRLRDLLADRRQPAAVHALQEAPVHRRRALLAADPARPRATPLDPAQPRATPLGTPPNDYTYSS